MGYLLGMTTVQKALASTGTQGAMPQQQPMAPMALAHSHQQPPQVLIHAHTGHPDPHPIALRHSLAHTDPYHKDEDKIVDAFMKLSDLANDGKATPEHMGQMDGLKIQLAGIQEKRRAEVDRLGQFMHQRQIQEDEQDAGSVAPGGQRALPQGAARGVHKDMNDQVGDASSTSSHGMRTTAQLSTAAGGWYSNGLSYQQKAIPMESDWSSEPQLTGTVTQQPGERLRIGAQSNMAMPTAAPKPAKGITAPAAPTRPQSGTAQPAKSVFQKADSKLQPVVEAVATIAPDGAGEPEPESGKVTQRK